MISLTNGILAGGVDFTMFIDHQYKEPGSIRTVDTYWGHDYEASFEAESRCNAWRAKRARLLANIQRRLNPSDSRKPRNYKRDRSSGRRIAALIGGAPVTSLDDLRMVSIVAYKLNLYRWLESDLNRVFKNWKQAMEQQMKVSSVERYFSAYFPEAYNIYMVKPAASDPTKIAYIKDIESLTRYQAPDSHKKEPKHTVTTVARFAEHVLKMSALDAKKAHEKWVADHAVLELKWARSEDDCVRVINDGPSDSCMAGLSYDGHIHPPAVRADSPDIAIAYLENSDGDVVARCICNTEDNKAARPYGDVSKIARALERAGYTIRENALVGCHIRYIKNNHGDGIILPYVDAGTASGGGYLYADCVRDGWLKLERGSGQYNTYHGYENNGVSEGNDERRCCDRCGDRMDDDDAYYSEYHGETRCSCCAERWVYAYVGKHDQDYVNKDCCIRVDGDWYVNDCDLLRKHDIYQCDECGDYYDLNELHSVEDGLVCERCSDRYYVTLDYGVYPNADYPLVRENETTTTHDGRIILESDSVEHNGLTYHEDDELPEEDEEDDEPELIPFVTATESAALLGAQA